MKRNSGIIGPIQSVSVSAASGVYDTFDQFQNSSLWPKSISYLTLSVNSGTVYENSIYSATLTTSNIAQNTTLYWTVLHGTTTSTDFGSSITSGSFTQSASSQQGSFTLTTALIGNTNKTSRTYQIQIRTGSTAGPVVYTSGVFTIPPITVSSLYWSPTTVNEGVAGIYLYFQAGNCGTWSSWNFSISYSGTAVSADTSGLATTSLRNPGVLTSEYNYSTIADATTEGTETVVAQLSYNGFNIGSPQTLTISDTSQAPTGTITPSVTTVTEGEGVTFTVSVSGSFTGTLYYTVNNVTGTMSSGDFTDGLLSGSFSVTNGSGSFVKTLVADGSSEGEAFSVSLRTVSVSGTVLSTTATISVTDAAAPSVTWSNPIITLTGSNTATTPGINNNYYRRHIIAFAYSQAELAAILGSSDVTIYGLRFYVTGVPTYQPYPTYAIGIKNGPFTSTSNPGTTGYTVVSPQQSQSFSAGYKEILFSTPFVWSATGGLAIVAAWGQVPTNYSSSGTTRIGAGSLFYNRTDAAGTFTVNTDAFTSTIVNARPVLEFKLVA